LNHRQARLVEAIYGYPSMLVSHSVRIKDFTVIEHVNPESGSAYLYLVKKPSGVDFFSHINRLRKVVGDISYAGIKDRIATAYFHVSSDKEIRDHRNVWLIGRTEKLSPMHNTGNSFRLNISIEAGSKTEIRESVEKLCEKKEHLVIANFYGYQRFGLKRPVNHLIGKALIDARYHEAWYHILSMYEEKPLPSEEASILKEAIKRLSIAPSYDRKIRELVVESYTSYIFNRTLTLYLQREKLNPNLTYDQLSNLEGITQKNIPCGKKVVKGFYFQYSMIKELEKRIAGIEFITPRSRIYRNRPAFIPVCNYSCRINNSGNIILSFSLPKGGYATTLLLVKGFLAE
jgi:tRNA(Glu) U13 pseudouridine synthase TruD